MKTILFLLVSLTLFAAPPTTDPELCPAPARTRALGDVTPVRNGAWATASTWSGGVVPAAGSKVVIPAGRTVTLDTHTAHTASIDIHGTLKVARKAASITTGYIIVHPTGLLTAGTVAQPHSQRFTITLTGTDRAATVMGGRVVGVMGGGKLELIGKIPTATWTMLANGKTAAVGATKIVLQDSPGWLKGDEIIITSTDFDYAQTEKRKIASYSATTKTITLDAPLKYLHYGNITTINHGVAGVPTTLDERAEVAVLTRYIKIQGAEDSEADGYGGHVMVMNDASTATIQGVELYRMGQKGLLGRYPMHWHNVNDGGSNSWMKGCSTHRSFNRGTTIHKTNNLRISDNVIYDTIGHGYFFEDGKEVGNVLTRNLVALVHKGPLDVLVPNIDLPAAYWITNPNNTFINNVAAGSFTGGFGFWYQVMNTPRPGSISDDPSYDPSAQPFGVFRGNRSHSIALPFVDQGGYEKAWGLVVELLKHPAPINIEEFTAFKHQKGQVWFAGGGTGATGPAFTVIRSSISGQSAIFNLFNLQPRNLLKDSLAIGKTANPLLINEPSDGERNLNFRDIHPTLGSVALNGYDFVADAENCVFANYLGVFMARIGGEAGGTATRSTFINDATYRTFMIGNPSRLTQEQLDSTQYQKLDAEDSFGNGGPGYFHYASSLKNAGSKNAAQGAKGVNPDETIPAWWTPSNP